MRGNYNAGGGAAFAQFLNSHCVSQNVSAGSAVLGGERNAHETVTSKLLNGFHREAFFLVYLFRKGLHFVFSELAVQIPKHHAAGQQTTAVLEGDHYVLNGTKIFITNAGYASVYIIFAMTDKAAGTKGISAFIVEKDFPGFSVGKKEKKMGIRGSATCELIMENCIVPKENLLGKEGKGFAIAMKTLDGGRIGIASQALGIGEGAVEETVKYVQERKQFGKRLSQMQNTQFQLADMHTRMKAAQFLVYSAACKKQAYVEAEMAGKKGESYSADAAMAKLFAAEAASDVTRRAVQLYGGYGYTREYPVERMMRDAKITEIYEGTSEVQRMVIAANLGVK